MKSALYKSLALHAVVFLLFAIDLPLFWHEDMTLSQPPIIVDLEQVKISEITNLPSKAKFADEDKTPAKVKKVVPVPENKPQPRPAPKPEVKPEPIKEPTMIEDTSKSEPEEAPLPPKKDFMVPPQPSKPKLPEKKPEPKKETPVKPAPKPETKKTAPEKKPEKAKPEISALKNLMDSVKSLEKDLANSETEATIKKGTEVANMGVEGGSGGSYFSELSISETDAIAARLRQCWNLDPGAMGIEGMIIEIRAYLNRDGSVQKVDILDSARYHNDAFFRSVADSAKRAVYICAPYNILSQKHADKYDMWKTMFLRFDPISHTVR